MHDEPEVHFPSHFDLENREPTMFLSTTDSLMRTPEYCLSVLQTIIPKQVRYQDLLDQGIFDIFPALALNEKLPRVDQQIIQDFDVVDPSRCMLSKYVKDAGHPSGALVS
jgi:hypothetical protein